MKIIRAILMALLGVSPPTMRDVPILPAELPTVFIWFQWEEVKVPWWGRVNQAQPGRGRWREIVCVSHDATEAWEARQEVHEATDYGVWIQDDARLEIVTPEQQRREWAELIERVNRVEIDRLVDIWDKLNQGNKQ